MCFCYSNSKFGRKEKIMLESKMAAASRKEFLGGGGGGGQSELQHRWRGDMEMETHTNSGKGAQRYSGTAVQRYSCTTISGNDANRKRHRNRRNSKTK